jgi:GNAT superfamily N-acetyltransferase
MKIDPSELDFPILHDGINTDHFVCNKKPDSHRLQYFFRKHAMDNQNQKLSVTWVAVKKDCPTEPLGYFSLACASIKADDLLEQEREGLPPYPAYPALLIGKFAVHDKCHNHGVGTAMMEYVFGLTIRLSEKFGCKYLIVESKPTVTWFYENKKRNFVRAVELEGGNVLFYKNTLTFFQ